MASARVVGLDEAQASTYALHLWMFRDCCCEERRTLRQAAELARQHGVVEDTFETAST